MSASRVRSSRLSVDLGVRRSCSLFSRLSEQFSSYLADDIGSEDLEDLYKEAHAKVCTVSIDC